jgi:hypothetical protein
MSMSTCDRLFALAHKQFTLPRHFSRTLQAAFPRPFAEWPFDMVALPRSRKIKRGNQSHEQLPVVLRYVAARLRGSKMPTLQQS